MLCVFSFIRMSTAILIELDVETLKIIRKGKKITQADLARSAGLGVRGYQKIEQGETTNPGIQTLARICEVLGVKLMQILREE